MSYRLVAEVLDHAPAMTPTERLLLVALAEQMRDDTREAFVPMDLLTVRVGVNASSIRATTHRLAAERGIDVRVPIGKDANGREVYAHRGRSTTYRMPIFEPPPGCMCQQCQKGDRTPAPLMAEKGAGVPAPSQRKALAGDQKALAQRRKALVHERIGAGTPAPTRTVDPLKGSTGTRKRGTADAAANATARDDDGGPRCRHCGSVQFADWAIEAGAILCADCSERRALCMLCGQRPEDTGDDVCRPCDVAMWLRKNLKDLKHTGGVGWKRPIIHDGVEYGFAAEEIEAAAERIGVVEKDGADPRYGAQWLLPIPGTTVTKWGRQ